MKYIKLFENFSLLEFDAKTYKWHWANKKLAIFDTEDDKYFVGFLPAGEPRKLRVEFESDRLGIGGTFKRNPSSAMRILETVREILLDFLKSNDDIELEFVGTKDSDDDGVSKRDRIYQYMMRELPDDIEWRLDSDGQTIHLKNSKVPVTESRCDESDKDFDYKGYRCEIPYIPKRDAYGSRVYLDDDYIGAVKGWLPLKDAIKFAKDLVDGHLNGKM